MCWRGRGKVKRTHGGAVLPGLTQHEDSFQQRLGEAVEAKRRLARAATALVGEDETIFIDSSTTAYYAAQRILSDVSRVTFLTNLMPAMELLTPIESENVNLIGVGGTFRALTLSFVGPCAVRTIESHLADRLFFSVRGITSEGHLTDSNPLEAEVKRTMVRQAARPVLLVDGRKFERRGARVLKDVWGVVPGLGGEGPQARVEALAESGGGGR